MIALRIVLVGFLFSWFGLICLMGNILFTPIIVLGLYKVQLFQNLSRDFVFLAWRFFILCTQILGYLKYSFEGIEKLGQSGQLIIANHPSLLDVVFVLSHIRRVNCIVKKELGKNIFLYPAIKACGYIQNTENEELLNKGLKVLSNGECLLVFPEGTRTKGQISFHKAPFYLAIHAAKTLMPVFIHMHPKSLQKGVKWYKTPSIKIAYKLVAQEGIVISEYEDGIPDSLRVRRLHSAMQTIYNKEIQ